MARRKKYIVTDHQEWSFDHISYITEQIDKINNKKYKLNIFPNQIEIVSSEQMIDAYCSVGLPIMYNHWSFGKDFIKTYESYKKGRTGLAYEMVINSNPCISYLMEDNTMVLQTLVIAHACYGHNHFFKNNYLFKEWTDPDGIIDYLLFAKKYISQCEEKHGKKKVERLLDAAHALKYHGITKYKRKPSKSEAEKQKEREEYYRKTFNEVYWTTIRKEKKEEIDRSYSLEENILYFFEKESPKLETWEREILRIVRMIAQYLYPQMKTKMLNEGFACYIHYKIMNDLYEQGYIDDGGMLEFLHHHTNVIYQPEFDSPYYSGSINPYALGFNLFRDIERVVLNPTEEDKHWFNGQDWVGSGDPLEVAKWIVENFSDESAILQFVSPKLIRDFRLFTILDDRTEENEVLDSYYLISAIHNERGYKEIIKRLAHRHDINNYIPNIEVLKYDMWDMWEDGVLTLIHKVDESQKLLKLEDAERTLDHVKRLWKKDVELLIEKPGGETITYLTTYQDK